MSEQPSALGVLFDLDGTLVDSMPSIASAMAQTLGEFGHEVTTETIMPLIGAPMQTLATQLTGVTDKVAEEIYRRYLALYYDEMMETTRPFDGAQSLLDRLTAAGIPLAIVTNKNEHGGKLMVEIQGWERYFEVVVGRDTTARPKPWSDGSLHALERLGVPPERAAIVGDTDFDMQAGRDGGLRYRVGILGARAADELDASGATHVVSDLESAGDILLEGVPAPAPAATE